MKFFSNQHPQLNLIKNIVRKTDVLRRIKLNPLLILKNVTKSIR